MALHPWLATVHAHMLTHGERMSCKDAVRMFGEPNGTTGAKLMHSAAGPNSGRWFKVEEVPYEGQCTRCVFMAVNPQGKAHTSWWASVNQVNSVWQLAERMES